MQVRQNHQRPDINSLLGYIYIICRVEKMLSKSSIYWIVHGILFRAYSNLLPLIVGHSHRILCPVCLNFLCGFLSSLFLFCHDCHSQCAWVSCSTCTIMVAHTCTFVYHASLASNIVHTWYVSMHIKLLLYMQDHLCRFRFLVYLGHAQAPPWIILLNCWNV